MLQLHGELPDVLGVKFEATIDRMIEAKPAEGQPGSGASGVPPTALVRCVTRSRSRRDRDAAAGAEAVVLRRRPAPRPGRDRGHPPGRRDGRAAARRSEDRTGRGRRRGCSGRGGAHSVRCRQADAGGAAARRALPVWRTANCATGCTRTICGPGRGVAVTSPRTWRWWRACTIRC